MTHAIKRTQAPYTYGVTLGGLEEAEREMICCPMIDIHGYGNTNMPKENCELRQKNPEMRSCYKGCKGKRPTGEKIVQGPRPEKQGPQPNSKRTKFFGMLANPECKPFTYAEAARLLGIKIITLRKYYYDYVLENGPSKRMITGSAVDPGDRKKQAFLLLKENPDVDKKDLMKKFGVTDRCIRLWISEFREAA